MSDLQTQYKLWDAFLKEWPPSRLATMTLDEYTKAGSKDTFTYWLESLLDEQGSIWGGSAFKFGVFSRKATEPRGDAEGRSYSQTHGWYSYHGETAEEAFLNVRSYVVHVATLAAQNKLDDIENFKKLGEAFKWKIAFHYQKDRKQPTIVDIFKPEALAAFTGIPAKQGMAALQRAALKRRPEGMGVLEFGRQMLAAPGVQEALNRKQNQTSISAPSDQTSTLPTTSAPITPDTCTNLIYYGPPGTGKTYTLNGIKRKYEGHYSFVTFHQSYGYEEFIEGLRPVLKKSDDTPSEVRYKIRAGVFKKLCKRARDNPNQRFTMLIDEINRGNISKIFGELITLIEPDKRGMEVTLPYSGELFSVPANVDIYGTMNTADRSLALLDTALRRRFEFVPLLPDTGTLAGLKVGDIDVPKMLERINERIEVLYDREHCIGHAYFMALKEDPHLETLADIFRKRILPLLEEYFFEDWHKIRLVLGDNQKPAENQFVRDEEQNLAALFGNDHGLDSYTTKRRYSVQESAFDNPAAYIGIYQPAA